MSEGSLPEYNVTGQDYSRRGHFTYAGPIIDIHAHVTMTTPSDKPDGPAGGSGASGSTEAAALMLDVAEEFGVQCVYSMCPPQDVKPLRERFGDRLRFNGPISKKPEEGEDAARRNLDQFLEAGVEIVKLWSAPRGRDRGFILDAPWRIACLKHAQSMGIDVVMAHVGDPDVWWTHTYQDTAKYGTKPQQYEPLYKMLELFPDMQWIAAHMGGDPEHPEHLEALLDKYPHLHFDTSAAKWQIREVSRGRDAIRSLISRYPDRFLYGSDLVTRHSLVRDHYVSRYWCQRTLWESLWIGASPIADADYRAIDGEGDRPSLRGLGLPMAVLEKVYSGNARRLLKMGNPQLVAA